VGRKAYRVSTRQPGRRTIQWIFSPGFFASETVPKTKLSTTKEVTVRRSIVGLSIVLAAATSTPCAHASNVGFDVGVNISNMPARTAPVYAAPPTAEQEPPVSYEEPPETYQGPPPADEEPPEFVAYPAMGFYAAVGTPYDLFYAGNRYYLSRGNAWFAAPCYNGPWVRVRFRELPRSLRRYPIAKMRYFRDEECRRHGRDYRGYRHFRPEWHDWRERHARWEGERPCEVAYHSHDRYREDDD
jgi:hypothetical protein